MIIQFYELYRKQAVNDWIIINKTLREIFEQKFSEAAEKISNNDKVYQDIKQLTEKALQKEINTALGE